MMINPPKPNVQEVEPAPCNIGIRPCHNRRLSFFCSIDICPHRSSCLDVSIDAPSSCRPLALNPFDDYSHPRGRGTLGPMSPTRNLSTIPSLPNLIYPTATQPFLKELYFPTNAHTPDPHNPMTYHLQFQPISKKFEIPEMPIFGPEFDPTGHVVNYNIYMDLRTML
ncbi:hypothetical protein ACLOJK_018051 [Asimina triloba]